MQLVEGSRGIALLCVASGMRTEGNAVVWYACQHTGRMAGDGLAAFILIAPWMMANDLQRNASEFRVRLPALEHIGERARGQGKDREVEQRRWKP